LCSGTQRLLREHHLWGISTNPSLPQADLDRGAADALLPGQRRLPTLYRRQQPWRRLDRSLGGSRDAVLRGQHRWRGGLDHLQLRARREWESINAAPAHPAPQCCGQQFGRFCVHLPSAPPGDGSGGFLVATDGEIYQVNASGIVVRDFWASNGLTYVDTNGEPIPLIDVNVTNDGEYVWTEVYPLSVDCSQEVSDSAVSAPCMSTDPPSTRQT